MINNENNLKSEESFKLRLAQTIAWCLQRADISNPKDCLRTPEFCPRVFEQDRFSAVYTVASGRQYRLGYSASQHLKIPKDIGGGRLLAYFPEMNLHDGAAEDETFGFLDVENLPPWDTWVAFFEDDPKTGYGSYLIAWIPPQFIEPVSSGIYVNPEECIMWLSDTDLSFAYKLKSEGLLV